MAKNIVQFASALNIRQVVSLEEDQSKKKKRECIKRYTWLTELAAV